MDAKEKKSKQYARQNEWAKANIERIAIAFNKGTRARLQIASEMCDESISEFVRKAVEARLKEFED